VNPALAGTRVLVVEDESILAMLIEMHLDDLGCKVVGSASRLQEALEKARLLELDIGLLDVNLAGEMSYPVASVLRARNVPVVFATGYGLSGLPVELHDAPVLTKPFLQAQLAEALLAAKIAT
jgi:CheY-like chemotaxis protein